VNAEETGPADRVGIASPKRDGGGTYFPVLRGSRATLVAVREAATLCGSSPLTASSNRLVVAGELIRHSLTRRTRHPNCRNVLLTCRSRRRFTRIFSSQKDFLVSGARRQRGHPCQKQPSTNNATLCLGQQKSGVPRIGRCLRHPPSPMSRNRLTMRSSVERFPLARTADIILERVLASYLSTSSSQKTPLPLDAENPSG
jgi:hypothetical protein